MLAGPQPQQQRQQAQQRQQPPPIRLNACALHTTAASEIQNETAEKPNADHRPFRRFSYSSESRTLGLFKSDNHVRMFQHGAVLTPLL
jgi:hypothetical protein